MTPKTKLASTAFAVSLSAVLAGCSDGTSRLPTDNSLDAVSASAATVRVSCEKRGNRRSRISVDGSNLAPGSYRGRVSSPPGVSRIRSKLQTAIGGEAQFDFDSNPNQIAAGATPLSPTYIQIVAGGPDVRGEILNSAGVVVARLAVNCTVR